MVSSRVSQLARRAVPPVLAAAGAFVLVPDLLGLDRQLPMTLTVAWRPQAVLGAVASAAALGVWRPGRPAAVALGAVAAVGLAALGTRIRRPAAPTAPRDGSDELTILCLNVFSGRADTADLAALIAREAPDLVVLPEAGCDFRDKLVPLVADLGYRGWAATPPGVRDIMGVVVLAAPRAGQLRVETGSELHYRHLRVSGGILAGRELHAVHTAAPRSRRLAVRWRRDLAQIRRWTCADPAPLVVGDLNATLDHGPLRSALGGCRSAAPGVRGLVGTYPSTSPRWFGIQIDHVLVPVGTATVRFAVHDVARSDHRGVLARVHLPAGGSSAV